MRLATWNVNSLGARLPRVEAWLAEMEPDIICLQETKLSDTAFPDLAFRALGYEAAHHGFNQWNGVAILSRVGLDDVVNGFPDDDAPDADARMIWATCGGIRVASVYVPNGRDLLDEHYRYKLAWLARLRAVLDSGAHGADPGQPLAICGDWNIAPADDDVWDIAAFAESTHVSEPGAGRLPRPCRSGGWSTSSGPSTRTRGSTPTGTTGPAASTRRWACASTTSWPPRPWLTAASSSSSTATPARAPSPPITPCSRRRSQTQ